MDELTVNDLYNRLIESPFDYEAGSDLGTEVIFVAFENFLRMAWTDQMGPVMTMQALDTLQERANKRVPGNFADFVNYLFKEMAPQNRRAFTALIKLLADLLDGCGNDSDRGALTLAFAELLVTDARRPTTSTCSTAWWKTATGSLRIHGCSTPSTLLDPAPVLSARAHAPEHILPPSRPIRRRFAASLVLICS